MGKLKEMVDKESALASSVKYNGRRIQMAGIGLFAKLIDASGQNNNDTAIGKLNALGLGTVNLVREESQRIFDELVETGEALSNRAGQTGRSGKTVPGKTVKAKLDIVKSNKPTAQKAPVKMTHAEKPETPEKLQKAKRAVRKVAIAPALMEAYEAAKQQAAKAANLPRTSELKLLALCQQAEEGDVKGRRPAKTKVEECEVFDARREIKGMKKDEAMNRYIEAVKSL